MRRLGWLLLAAGAVGALALAVLRAQRPPEGPVEVAWDRERCARCRMLVSEPPFAGQVHEISGAVRYFDDPGCLLLWTRGREDAIRGIWLHHLERERWVAAEDAVFVPTEPTPMGYGLGVLERGEAAGADFDGALRLVLEREQERSPGDRERAAP